MKVQSKLTVEPHRWVVTSQDALNGLLACATDDYPFAKLRSDSGLLRFVAHSEIASVVPQLLNEFEPEVLHIVTDGDQDLVLDLLPPGFAFDRVLWHDYATDPEASMANFCMPEPSVRHRWQDAGCKEEALAIRGSDEFRQRWKAAFYDLVEAVEAVQGPGAMANSPEWDDDDFYDDEDANLIASLRPQPDPAEVRPWLIDHSMWIAVGKPSVANDARVQAAAASIAKRPEWLSFPPVRVIDQDLIIAIRPEISREGQPIEVRVTGPVAAASIALCRVHFVDGQGRFGVHANPWIDGHGEHLIWEVHADAKPPVVSLTYTLQNPKGAVQARLLAPDQVGVLANEVIAELIYGFALARHAEAERKPRLLGAGDDDEEEVVWVQQIGDMRCEVTVWLPADVGLAARVLVQVSGLGTTPAPAQLLFNEPGKEGPAFDVRFTLRPDESGGLRGTASLDDADGQLLQRLRRVTTVQLLPQMNDVHT
jgi:hypothetical protein